jgi:predicted AAA+ superfamily ATPase
METNGVMMEKFTERFFTAPVDSFFIFGPRGTGKSTWLKKTFPDAYLGEARVGPR